MMRRARNPISIILWAGLALHLGGCACACRPDKVATAAPTPAAVAAQPAAPADAIAPADDDTVTPLPEPPSPEAATLTEVGRAAPAFTVATLGGEPFSLGAQKGKVVLVNWFATWCGPCKAEMPHLKDRVWEAFKSNPDFVMISISREEDATKVAPFVAERALPWTIGLDTDRTAFARYAEAYIPRNHVIGRDGRIVFQSEGFEEAEFAAMITAIAGELAGR